MTWSFASAHRLLCDLKFCSSASTHGLFFGLKFRLRIRNILRLKVPQFHFRIQNSVWLRTLKWRNSASAQGKYCGLEVTQLRFHTINLVRLEVSQFRFHTRALTKSRSSASAQRISCDLKFRSFASAQGIYYVSKFSSSAFANRQSVTWSSSISHNILWLEFPQFRFRKKDVIWNSALLLLHENITFRWKIHSHSTTHPFLNYRADLHDWWTLWRTEKQRNRDAPGKSHR